MPPQVPDVDAFRDAAVGPGSDAGAGRPRLIPVVRRLLGDALTPVLAYRRLVRPDPRLAPSFLFESVVGGENVARYSFIGSRPVAEVEARGHEVTFTDHRTGEETTRHGDDPLAEVAAFDAAVAVPPHTLPWARGLSLPAFTGGWVGYAGYDTVRYLEPDKVPFKTAPHDDRGLPDLHFALYRDVVAFDHVQKTVLVIAHADVTGERDVEAAYEDATRRLDEMVKRLSTHHGDRDYEHGSGEAVPPVHVPLDAPPPPLPTSNMGEGGYQRAVEVCKGYIAAGDAFQIVPSQRFELLTRVDPFDVYRALRVVNPSPYMFYLQAAQSILVGSSPEILCRVEEDTNAEYEGEHTRTRRTVISRPLAGTRRRGATAGEDAALERELLADPKETAEHVMLVDLHRNDVGRVAVPGTVETPELLVVERYSHVMHISSEVRGTLRPGLTAWDALRVSLPVGTVSGAPKVRAMQIIDEVEPTRRGPYGGAVGYADLAGNMDMAIALRTMVVTQRLGLPEDTWVVHLQAGGGIVADSDPDAEHQETLNKAAALAKAVELAERLFGG